MGSVNLFPGFPLSLITYAYGLLFVYGPVHSDTSQVRTAGYHGFFLLLLGGGVSSVCLG